MTHGSVFSSAGQQLMAGLAQLLPGWRVNYQPPLNEAELAEQGELRAVYLEPLGDSTIEPFGMQGFTEFCPLTVVFHWLATRTQLTQAQIDDEVSEAFGVLLDWVTANHRGVPPGGWDSLDFRFTGMSRSGGYLEGIAGRGRRLEATVEARGSRC